MFGANDNTFLLSSWVPKKAPQNPFAPVTNKKRSHIINNTAGGGTTLPYSPNVFTIPAPVMHIDQYHPSRKDSSFEEDTTLDRMYSNTGYDHGGVMLMDWEPDYSSEYIIENSGFDGLNGNNTTVGVGVGPLTPQSEGIHGRRIVTAYRRNVNDHNDHNDTLLPMSLYYNIPDAKNSVNSQSVQFGNDSTEKRCCTKLGTALLSINKQPSGNNFTSHSFTPKGETFAQRSKTFSSLGNGYSAQAQSQSQGVKFFK